MTDDRTMPGTNELTILIHPLAGDPFEVIVRDAGPEEALVEKITQAIDAGGSLRLSGRSGETEDAAVVFNVRNIVAVRVLSRGADGDTGQYL
jgi:hypothetical protein